jgi:hypothetical protein
MNFINHIIFLLKSTVFFDAWIDSNMMIRDKEIRRYFKRPKVAFSHGWIDQINTVFAPFFGFCVADINFKNKNNKPIMEGESAEPFAQINIFGYALKWTFECPVPINQIAAPQAYWESMMDYYNILCLEHHDKNLYRIISENTYSDINGISYKTSNILTNAGYQKYLGDFITYDEEQ